jgi:hypothetical protein
MENFGRLKKIDFDHCLAGFSLGSVKKGSMRLFKVFSMCAKQNYGAPGPNRSHEDFILAASYIAKDRDKNISIDDGEFWDLAVDVLMEYISISESTGIENR